MKLYLRILLITPLILISAFYLKFNNPDDVGFGIANLIIDAIFIVFFIITVPLAFIGAFFKREFEKHKAQPLILSIIGVLFLVFIYHWTFRGHTHGKQWILAIGKEEDSLLPNHSLILRTNGNFTFNSTYVDFGFSVSGTYQKSGDTIILNKSTIDKADLRMKTVYLVTAKELIPLNDTTNKWTFKIIHNNSQ